TAGDTDITVSAGGTLTFTPQNFGTNQNVTLAAAEDGDATNGTATITVSATGGIASETVSATESDNEPGQASVADPTSLRVPEGGTAAFGVRLAAQPATNVTVTCTDGDGDADITVLPPNQLVFTPQNWNVVQNVTVAAAEDGDTTNGTQEVNCAAAGLPVVIVTVTEADNDPGNQAIVVTPEAVDVPEGGTETFG